MTIDEFVKTKQFVMKLKNYVDDYTLKESDSGYVYCNAFYIHMPFGRDRRYFVKCGMDKIWKADDIHTLEKILHEYVEAQGYLRLFKNKKEKKDDKGEFVLDDTSDEWIGLREMAHCEIAALPDTLGEVERAAASKAIMERYVDDYFQMQEEEILSNEELSEEKKTAYDEINELPDTLTPTQYAAASRAIMDKYVMDDIKGP